MSSPSLPLRGLYVITDERLGGGHLTLAHSALEGGARIIQLRDKSTPPQLLLPIALELRRMTRATGALLLINDQLDLALLCDADGLHLGPDDWPLEPVRRVWGSRLLGASCSDLAQVQEAARQGADYVGVGAIFATQTKTDAGAPLGLAVLREIVAAATLPVAAIGGIGPESIALVRETGVAMACVVSAIAAHTHEERVRATRHLVQSFATPPPTGSTS